MEGASTVYNKIASITLPIYCAVKRSQTVVVGDLRATFPVTTREEGRHFWPKLEERDLIQWMSEDVRHGDVIFDVGAHIGIHACLLGDVDRTKLVLFEPHRANRRRLEENINRNGVNTDIHEVALSNREQTVEMGIDSDRVGAMGHLMVNREESIEIETRQADKMVEQGDIPQPDFIKIDVEGSEAAVLDGMKETLADCRVVYVEMHPDHMAVGEESRVKQLLSDHFDVERINVSPQAARYHLRCIDPS